MRLASLKQLNDLIRLGERSLTATSIFAFRLGPLDAFALCRSPADGVTKNARWGSFGVAACSSIYSNRLCPGA